MVCKEDVVTWFKELTSHKRIDVMCTLLNMCLPFELRFLGTCLEDLGKRDFHDLRDAENRANNVSEFSELQCISDKRTQRKLVLYLSLLHSCNHACSNGLFKILADFDFGEISNITNNTTDENPLDELLLIYTLALNHPAFTYEQKAEFGTILVKLQEEENKLYAARHPVGIGLVYVKNPLQACIPCPASEDQGQLGPCTGISMPSSHHAGDVKGRGSLPPGLTLSPGLTPDQVASYVHVTFPSGPQPVPAVPWPGSPLMMASLCGLPGEAESSPYPSSPLVSRQSSPSQSGSPSRAGSPARALGMHVTGNDRSQNFKGQRRTDRTPTVRSNCIDGSTGQQQSRGSLSRKGSTEPDGLRDALGKEMPSYVHSLQNYSTEELRRMGDEELRELGLSPGAVQQLRALVGKLQGTNGLCLRTSNDSCPSSTTSSSSRPDALGGPGRGMDMTTRRRDEEAGDRRGGRGRPEAAAAATAPGLLAPGPCFTCFVPVSAAPARFVAAPPLPPPAAFCCPSHGIQTLRIDERSAPAGPGHGMGTATASSSDSSAGPSPPHTPSAAAVPPAANWSAVGVSAIGPAAPPACERWSPAAPQNFHLDDQDKERRPLAGEEKSIPDEFSPASITTTTITSSTNSSSTTTTTNSSSNSSCSSAASVSSNGGGGGSGNGNGGSGCGSSSSSSSSSSSTSSNSAMGGGGGGSAARSRPPGGLARGKATGGPPGVQTVARGRGPGGAPTAERPGVRRDGQVQTTAATPPTPSPALNGAPPPPPPARLPPPPSAQQQTQDDRGKMYFVQSEFGNNAPPHSHAHSLPPHSHAAHVFSSAPTVSSHATASGSSHGAPPAYSPPFLPAHFTQLRSGSALFPSFAPAGYMRPFPFSAPNGDLVYGFHPAGPQTPPPPPPPTAAAAAFVPAPMVAAFAPAVPPPKLSCYNCGSHSHHAADCKDPTMEEMTKPGQYRLDFSPYPKGQAGGELSSSEK